MFGKQIMCKVEIGATCQDLYLDFNCLVHQCANMAIAAADADVVADADASNAATRNVARDASYYEPLVINAVIAGLVDLINIVRPTRMMYIGIDGLCPRAKMSQQRKRRYMSAWRKEKTQGDQAHVWDSNIITPGTRFMTALDEALEHFVKRNASMFKFEIVFSGSCEPGEGEHKIFDIINKNAATASATTTATTTATDAVIYGLDADLILLSMLSPKNVNVRLLRERPEFGQLVPSKLDKAGYIFVDIGQLKGALLTHFDQPPEFINDYVMLSTLLGNDFVPPLSYLNIRDGGIDMVVDAYIEAMKLCGGRLIDVSSSLNTTLLRSIIAELATKEDARMREASCRYYTKVPTSSKALDSASTIDSYPQYTKHVPVISGPDWRRKYYASLFINGKNASSVVDISSDYADALAWVHAYYFTRDASLTWYYPHAYSPLAADLILQVACMDQNNAFSNVRKTNVAMFNDLIENHQLQLLSVLPPASSSLLDDKHVECMNEITRGFAHQYPSHFIIHTFLKTYLWECVPVLPAIDICGMARAINAERA